MSAEALLASARVFDFLLAATGGSELLARDEKSHVTHFTGLGTSDNDAAMSNLLILACSPGAVGAMATDAAANDPLFWPLHPLYDRLWANARLEGSLSDDWASSEEQSGDSCPGAGLDDLLPFTGFPRDNDDDENYPSLSNQDLLDFFDPSNDDLPYVYDSFN